MNHPIVGGPSRPHTRPAGPAEGCLTGSYPSPALGPVGLSGAWFYDEFIKDPSSTVCGDREWVLQSLGGVVPTAVNQTPTATSEVGVCRLSTTASSPTNEGGYMATTGTPFFGLPALGTLYIAKIRLVDTTDTEVWSGLMERAARVAPGQDNDFVGFRAIKDGAGVGNWYGVCRNGTNETTVDLGVNASTTWVILGWQRLPSWRINRNNTIAAGVQFFVGTGDRMRWQMTATGSRVTTNLPDEALRPVPLAVCNAVNLQNREAEIDFLDFGGRIAR